MRKGKEGTRHKMEDLRGSGNPPSTITEIQSQGQQLGNPIRLPILQTQKNCTFWRREHSRKSSGFPKMIALPPIPAPGHAAVGKAVYEAPTKAIQQSQFARAMLALPTMDEAGAGAHSKMRKQQQKERMAANSMRPGLLVDSIVSDFLSSEGSSVNQLLNFLAGGGEDFIASSAKAAAKKKKKKMKESNLMDASEVYNFPELSKVHKMSFSVARNTFLTALPDTEEQLGGKLWRAALRKVKLMLSVTRIFYWLIEMAVNCGRLRYKLLQSRGNTNESSRKTPGKDDEPQAPLLVANLIGFNLENYRARKRHFVGTLSDEMRMALLKSPEEKSDEDADVLQKLTLNMPAFMKYDHTVRRALSRVIGYGLFGKGRVIVRQGHAAENFYFILSGQVEVQKEVDNESFGLSVLESGDSFGELALLHDVRRSATIVTKSETELLWVNKDDFIQVLKLEATRDLEDKESFLLSIPFFAGMTPTAIKSLAYNSQIREVQPNAVLFAEGEAAGYVFIVREGTARLIKYVPFEEVYLDKKKSKYILLPHPLPSNLEPPFGSRKVGRFLRVQEVGPCDFFGDGAALAAMGTAQQHASMSLMSSSIEQLIDPIIPQFPGKPKSSTSNAAVLTIPTTPSKRSRKSTPDELSVLLKEATVSPFSLVSTTRVKCLLISRIDFARCCTIELAKVAGERIAIERRTLLDMKKLQETYLYTRHWRDIRKKILASSMSDAFERQHKGNANNLF